jgi:hypothetical protein
VKEELDNYSWTVPKYSLFEPLDNRQGSIFLWKVGVSFKGKRKRVNMFQIPKKERRDKILRNYVLDKVILLYFRQANDGQPSVSYLNFILSFPIKRNLCRRNHMSF